MRASGSAGLLALLILVGFILACSGGSAAPEEPSNGPGEPAPTREPDATAAAAGRIRATLEASCRLGEYSAQVDLDYRARGEGSSSVSRVRLLINGRIELDTGAMSEPDVWGNRTVHVVAGRRYRVQLLAD